MNIYPWQEQAWSRLMAEPENLPHALLLTGQAGLGKLAFAQAIAARLLCETPERQGQMDRACGHCKTCKWFAAGTHPDFRMVQPEEDEESGGGGEGAEEGAAASASPSDGKASSKTASISKAKATKKRTLIRISQIRELSDFVFLGSHQQGRRIVILHPAEALNAEAANSLLKILEEPPPSICFILVSNSWRKLLPTIRSRCRLFPLACPDQKAALAWLKQEGVKSAEELLVLAGGAPLLARDWASQNRLAIYQKAIAPLSGPVDDPIAMAAQWQPLLKGEPAFDLYQLVEATQKWMSDLIQLKMTGTLRYHPSKEAELRRLGASASLTALLACQDELLRLQGVARHPLNAQLFLEDMAARYARALAPARRNPV